MFYQGKIYFKCFYNIEAEEWKFQQFGKTT